MYADVVAVILPFALMIGVMGFASFLETNYPTTKNTPLLGMSITLMWISLGFLAFILESKILGIIFALPLLILYAYMASFL